MLPVLAWMLSLLAATVALLLFLEAAAQLLTGMAAAEKAVGIHSAALGLSIFMVASDSGLPRAGAPRFADFLGWQPVTGQQLPRQGDCCLPRLSVWCDAAGVGVVV